MKLDFEEDEVKNLIIFYALSKDVNFDCHPVKRVDMTKSDSIALNYDFFKSLKNKNNVRFLKTIEKYFEQIYESDIVEGGVYGIENKVKKIIVPKLDNAYAASILTHEITHALEFEGKVNIRQGEYYQEIVPFLNQFLFIEYLEKYYNVEGLRRSNVDFMVHNQLLYNARGYGDSMNEEGVVNVSKAREHLKYIYGSLYSLVLYEWYQIDKDFMKFYSKIYNNKNMTVEDLLEHYDVNLGDINNVRRVNLIKSLSKN